VKIRTLLTAGAVAAVALATAFAAPGIASAANGPAPAINVVQPASPTSYENSAGAAATGTVSGLIPRAARASRRTRRSRRPPPATRPLPCPAAPSRTAPRRPAAARSSAAQNITSASNNELLVVGNCVTGTTTAFLEKCVGATSQEWTRQSNGEYVLKSNGKCLTAPNANSGTQLTLAACENTANQHWAVP